MTDTNDGSSGARASTARQSTGSSSSERGGKNSNEKVGPVAELSSSATVPGRVGGWDMRPTIGSWGRKGRTKLST